eukprot:g1085.t1
MDDDEDEDEAEEIQTSEPLQRKVKRKATPWTKVPVSDDDEEADDEEVGGEKATAIRVEVEVPKDKPQVKAPVTAGNNFCFFSSCSLCGQDT